MADTTLTTWQKNGLPILNASGRGKASAYNTKQAINWRIQYEVQKIAPTGTKGVLLDRNAEDARLKKHQADKAEIEAQIAQRKVILVEDVKDILNQVAVIYGTQVDAIGGRLANDLAAITDPSEIRAKIFKEGRRIRNQTADALKEFAAIAGGGVIDAGAGSEPEDG